MDHTQKLEFKNFSDIEKFLNLNEDVFYNVYHLKNDMEKKIKDRIHVKYAKGKATEGYVSKNKKVRVGGFLFGVIGSVRGRYCFSL